LGVTGLLHPLQSNATTRNVFMDRRQQQSECQPAPLGIVRKVAEIAPGRLSPLWTPSLR
jgi:hypothetical protein